MLETRRVGIRELRGYAERVWEGKGALRSFLGKTWQLWILSVTCDPLSASDPVKVSWGFAWLLQPPRICI